MTGLFDAEVLEAMARSPVVFLNKTLTKERAVELVNELGFLGICDLVQLLAVNMKGTLECDGPLIHVKIKRKPRAKKAPGAVSRGSRGT